MDYTFYKENGEISFTASCSSKPSPSNGKYIEGKYDPEKYRVIDGVPVRKEDSEIERAEIERAWVELRRQRNEVLSATDWTQLPDASVDKKSWADYRKKLRDMPSKVKDPKNVSWPKPPE